MKIQTISVLFFFTLISCASNATSKVDKTEYGVKKFMNYLLTVRPNAKECLQVELDGSSIKSSILKLSVIEIHNKNCGGDPNTSPTYGFFNINTETGAVLKQDRVTGEYVPVQLVVPDLQKGLACVDKGDFQCAFANLKPLAEEGHAVAQINLGFMYLSGQGVKQDYFDAVEWFRLAAEQGYAFAQWLLGTMYESGQGVKQDDFEAVKWFRLAAEQGLAGAQSSLGTMYKIGQGVKQDDFEAVKWFRKAADQGDADAQSSLGTMYKIGQGVKQDDFEAVKWFRKAAEQGDADAQFFLGAMYESGQGVKQDKRKAKEWFGKACDNRISDGCHNYKILNEQGY